MLYVAKTRQSAATVASRAVNSAKVAFVASVW